MIIGRICTVLYHKKTLQCRVSRDVGGGDYLVEVLDGPDKGKRIAVNRSNMRLQDENPAPTGVITKDR